MGSESPDLATRPNPDHLIRGLYRRTSMQTLPRVKW